MSTQYGVLIKKLSVEQKVALLTGDAAFSLRAEPDIGLHQVNLSDGPTGVRGLTWVGGEAVVLFPSATVLASTWDPEVLETVGDIVGDEAERQEIATVLGPTINLHRSTLGGRLFEQYSEDPVLTGHLAAAYTRGLQKNGIGACLKHLVANESETERNTVSIDLSEKTLRELYLLPFEIAVEDAQPWMIMAAYNRVNGTAATEHAHLLRDILRKEWGWDGVVVSDWYATRTAKEAAQGGLDLVMPGPRGPWGDALVDIVRAGAVPESTVDEKVERILRLADRAGLLGTNRGWNTRTPAPDSAQRAEQMTRLAAAGAVLLRNEQGTLPLQDGTRIAAIGRPILDTVLMGGGSATVNAPYLRTIADGLRDRTERFGDLVIRDGVELRTRPLPAAAEMFTEDSLTLQYWDSDGALLSEEQIDTPVFALGWDDSAPNGTTRATIRGTVATAGMTEIGVIGTGDWAVTAGEQTFAFTLRAEGHDPGEATLRPPSHIQRVWMQYGMTIEATVDIAAGGYAASSADNAELDAANASGGGHKAFVLAPVPRPADDVIAEAVDAARAADVAVVAVGLTEEQETEAVDKTTLALPGEQDRLVREVAAVARRTVVIVNASTPVLMPWENEVDAVLVVGLPGQNGGDAVASLLLGDLEPTGRLVTTWPAVDGAAPAWSVTPGAHNRLAYTEGTFIGHRGHAPFGQAPVPAHWFGEGMTYGAVLYEDVRVLDSDLEVDLRGGGERDVREVVQAYLRPDADAEPVRLIGFTVLTVPKNGQVTAHIQVESRARRVWDEARNRWKETLLNGDLLIARGLGDVRLRGRLE